MILNSGVGCSLGSSEKDPRPGPGGRPAGGRGRIVSRHAPSHPLCRGTRGRMALEVGPGVGASAGDASRHRSTGESDGSAPLQARAGRAEWRELWDDQPLQRQPRRDVSEGRTRTGEEVRAELLPAAQPGPGAGRPPRQRWQRTTEGDRESQTPSSNPYSPPSNGVPVPQRCESAVRDQGEPPAAAGLVFKTADGRCLFDGREAGVHRSSIPTIENSLPGSPP